jgi:hypothetical protein
MLSLYKSNTINEITFKVKIHFMPDYKSIFSLLIYKKIKSEIALFHLYFI